MVMNPLDALSLAGTIVQFVDFSSKVLSRSRELYRSSESTLSVNQNLDLVATDLLQLSQKLTEKILDGPDSADVSETDEEQTLRKLCKTCSDIALELKSRLNGLRAESRHQKWKSFQEAIKSVWSESDIRELMGRLSIVRDSVQLHVVVELR
jgi:hypothetical protein